MKKHDEVCSKIREFNRFYTVWMEFLNPNYLGSSYSISETRVIFEIKTHSGCIQSAIARKLHIDKSYLSRIVRRLTLKGLVSKSALEDDRRAEKLSLTKAGDDEAERLIALTDSQIKSQISTLSPKECDKLFAALNTVILILGKEQD